MFLSSFDVGYCLRTDLILRNLADDTQPTRFSNVECGLFVKVKGCYTEILFLWLKLALRAQVF